MNVNTIEQAVPFAIALAIGALVGVEREWRKREETTAVSGGIRTFILQSMAGAVSAWLSQRLDSMWLFIGTGFCMTAIIITSYVLQATRNDSSHGLTTAVASLVTFVLGGTVVFGEAPLAVALAIVTSTVLAFKQPLHRAVGWLSQDDLRAILKLLIATFVVLPVLPDRALDPWGALNPYKMWWLVILISGLSLVGYVASRWIGEHRALPLTGLCGGLVSSTAVSLDFARRSRERDGDAAWADSLAGGILAAWLVMFGRIFAIVAVMNGPLLREIWIPFAAMTGATVLAGLFTLRGSERGAQTNGGVAFKNPFSLTSAVKFAAFFAAVLLVVKFVQMKFAGEGMYFVAGLAGLTDVDAITLSMAEYGRATEHLRPAGIAIAIATLANTLVKCGFVLALGSRLLKLRMLAATAAVLVAGVATELLLS